MKTFAVTIPGNPIPKARPRVVVCSGQIMTRAYTPKRTKDYEDYIKEAVAVYWRGDPLTCSLSVELIFYRENRRRADVDNLGKLILDALHGIVYVNDDQVTILHIEKHIDKINPRVEIELTYSDSEAKEQDGKRC